MTSKKYIEGGSSAALFLLCALCVGSQLLTIDRSQYDDDTPKPILFYEGKTLAEVFFDENGNMEHCRLHELEEEADAEPIIKGTGLPTRYPNFKTMVELINNCTRLEMPQVNGTLASPTDSADNSSTWSPWSLMNGIVPGTKWCGVGDIADSFEQLGVHADVDACCRAHDHCPVKLKAFRAGYGLINLSLYTKSHCDCDKEFYSCLKESRNKLSDAVGNFYFNFLRAQCLKDQRAFVCVENRTEIDGNQQCVKWSADPNSKKMQVTISQLTY